MGTRRFQALNMKPLNVALFDKRAFADVNKDLNMRSVMG